MFIILNILLIENVLRNKMLCMGSTTTWDLMGLWYGSSFRILRLKNGNVIEHWSCTIPLIRACCSSILGFMARLCLLSLEFNKTYIHYFESGNCYCFVSDSVVQLSLRRQRVVFHLLQFLGSLVVLTGYLRALQQRLAELIQHFVQPYLQSRGLIRFQKPFILHNSFYRLRLLTHYLPSYIIRQASHYSFHLLSLTFV